MNKPLRRALCLALMSLLLLFALTSCNQQQTPVATEAPTQAPTTEPTAEPAAEPMAEPTADPTAEPTNEPTAEPADEPTQAPTDEPTAEPVAEAAVALKAESTAKPTAEPTVEPTATPMPKPAVTPTAAPAAAPQSQDDSAVVLTVGDTQYTKGEMQEMVTATTQQYAMYVAMVYGQEMDITEETFQRNITMAVLQSRAQQKVLEDKAKELGLWEVDEEQEAALRQQAAEEYEATIQEYMPQYLARLGADSETADEATLQEARDLVVNELALQGYSEDWLADELQRTGAMTRLQEHVLKDVSITDEEARASYDAMIEAAKAQYDGNPDLYVDDLYNGSNPVYVPVDFRLIQHIYLPFTTDEEQQAAVQQAEDILAQIKAGETTFEDAMANYGQDSAMLQGAFAAGYPVFADSTFEETFTNAAMALPEVGDLSEVIVGQSGVHILRYADNLAQGSVPYEDEADEYIDTLLVEKRDTVYNETVAEWMEAANITYDVEPLLVDYGVSDPTYYGANHEDTQVMDRPDDLGITRYALRAGTPVALYGTTTVGDVQYGYVQVLGGEGWYGYVQMDSLTPMEEAQALAAADAALVAPIDAPAEAPNPLFTLAMNDGSLIYGELYPDVAPLTVGNFISLANSGFYDGLIFHRVMDGFVIQGGDPNGDGSGGPGYGILGEFSTNGVENDILHERGVLSMARSTDVNSAGSQFFIVLEAATHLDGSYAAFGRVIEGMDVADAIVAAPRVSEKPMVPQMMTLVRVETYGVDYPMEAYVAPEATEAPATEAPAEPTEAPATEAPTTAPATEAPTTEPTKAPATDAPADEVEEEASAS